MKFLVSNNGWEGWYSYDQLKHMCTLMDEEGDYQPDSPEAQFITGYDTDSYADTLCSLVSNLWEFYLEECEEEDKTPTWDDCWDNHIWENPEYQLCHTWLRVTNIRTESDEEIKQFAKDCDYCTMEERLGLDS